MRYAVALIAASLVATPAMAQEESAFQGPWVGAVVGYDHVGISDDLEAFDESEEGVLYGIAAGYDMNIGGAVVGVEAEYTDSSAKFDADGFNMNQDLYFGARLGAEVSKNVLVYAKGGYTNATAKLGGVYEEDFDGFRVGAGAEYAMGNYFGRLEYRYSDYGALEFMGDETSARADRHQGAVVIGMRF